MVTTRGNRGGTLVDVLVGTAIAIIAVVAIQRTFVTTLAIQRSAVAAAEAEQSALLATFAIGESAMSAGAGIASASADLDTCPASADAAVSLRPIGILVVDSGSADRPDTLIVKRSMQARMPAPAAVSGPAAPGAPIRIRSPDGIAAGDRIITIGRDGTCAQAVVASAASDVDGVTELVHDATGWTMPANGVVVDLGPAGLASILRLDVGGGSLRSTDLSNADAPSPLVANVVNMKFQYGVDRDGNGTLDEWVAADRASALDASSVLAAPATVLARIVALRIGVVARSEAFDPRAPSYHWVLFDCAPALPSGCPGRIEGVIPATGEGGYRYATREFAIALYNTLWNRSG